MASKRGQKDVLEMLGDFFREAAVLLLIFYPLEMARNSNGDLDLTGGFCTSGSEREFTLEGSWYADEEIQAGADRDVVTAG